MNNSGFILLDKPVGMNSRKAGAICARMFGAKTFGHIGTLDPMASGLLILALGDATKLIPYMESDNVKEYLFSIKFGINTDTLDVTGQVIDESNVIPTPKQVVSACEKLIGEIDQIPPAYSAVHVGGVRAHKLARAGKSVEMPVRKVKIHSLESQQWSENPTFFVRCSAGTYVRSIARDIAKLCGTLGVASMIRRVRTNGFEIKDAVKLDFLENLYNNSAGFEEYLKPLDFGLGDIPVLSLNDDDTKLYKNGGFIKVAQGAGLVRVYNNEILVGIGTVDGELLKPKRTI